jgi:GNAT superfamily N-acetyltransferase
MLEALDKAAYDPKGQPESDIRVCNATTSNIPEICAISSSATKKFGTIPALSDLANDQEEPIQIQKWLAQGRIYLAVSNSEPVGFIAAYPVDGAIYIAEVSVVESFQGKGVGGKLVDAVIQWALLRCMHDGSKPARVSLTTFADVPWNGKWYEKRGFKEVDPVIIGPWHVEMVADDKMNLERPGYRRCCMLWESETPPIIS